MRFCAIFLFFLASVFPLSALEPGAFSLSIIPSGEYPLPVTIDGVTDTYHSIGGGASLNADYVFPFAPVLFGGVSLSGVMAPANKAVTNYDSLFTFLSLSARLGLHLELIPNLTLELAGKGGWSLVMNEGRAGNGPYFGGEAGFSVQFNETFGLGLFASYADYWSLLQNGPQYQSLSARLGFRFAFGGGSSSVLKMEAIRFVPLFPAFRGLYAENPLGEITLRNGGGESIRDLTVSLFVPGYMEAPKLCAAVKEMGPQEKKTVPLVGIFTDAVLSAAQDTSVAAEISAEFRLKGETVRLKFPGQLVIKSRNAMGLDDARKAAAFVTPGDPAVKRYADSVTAAVRSAGGSDISANIRSAMGLFESLRLSGVAYQPDASAPYADFSTGSSVEGRIGFPSQTLSSRTGDCDDLSVLYCALLESAGVDTALIAVPGRMMMAFSADLDPDMAEDSFSDVSGLIFREEKTWIPVDVTLLKDGFLKAWDAGAMAWRDNGVKAAAGFQPVRASWDLYKAAGSVPADASAAAPAADEARAAYSRALAQFVEREIGAEEKVLLDRIAASGEDPAPRNALGVLYGRYGLYEKAAAIFDRMLEKRDTAAALVNRGNIYFMKREWANALALYERAYALNKNDASVILDIAKAKHEMKDIEGAEEFFSILEAKDRYLARKYSYLGPDGSRDQNGMETNALAGSVVWME